MNLHQLLETVRNSRPSQWAKINQYGPIEPPHFHSSSDGRSITLDVTTHYEQAVFIENVNLSLAWGLDVDYSDPTSKHDRRRAFAWADAFVNSDVSLIYVDVRWAGALVYRQTLAIVDGSHGCIPLPRTAGSNPDDTPKYEVSSDEVALAKLIGLLTDSDPTEQTLHSIGAEIV